MALNVAVPRMPRPWQRPGAGSRPSFQARRPVQGPKRPRRHKDPDMVDSMVSNNVIYYSMVYNNVVSYSMAYKNMVHDSMVWYNVV